MRLSTLFARRSDCIVAAGALALLSSLASCRPDSEAVPTFGGSELYPLRVGTYRTYAVADTTWTNRRPLASSYQVREAVADSFPGPATSLGAPSMSYRVVRAHRTTAAQPWVEDSVFVLTPLPAALLLNRNNERTIELLFPVRAGRRWNRYAFGVHELGGSGRPDSLNREYRQLGEALTLALPGGQQRHYEQTVRTYDQDEDDAYYLATFEQVYAPGEGPVLRRRRRYLYTDGYGGSVPVPGVIVSGFSRRETLLERGKL